MDVAMAGCSVGLLMAAGAASSAGREIYPDPAQARADLAAALKTAAATHKRVLIDFGGNWCGDCQVLDIYFHNETNRPILESELRAGACQHRPLGRERRSRAALPGAAGERRAGACRAFSENGKLLFSQQTAAV